MENNNLKSLLENFENASNQLDQALETIRTFSENLAEYAKLSDKTEEAITKVENIQFEKIEEYVRVISDNIEIIPQEIDDLMKKLNDNAEQIGHDVDRILEIDNSKLDALIDSNKAINKELTEIKDSIKELIDKTNAVSNNINEEG